MNNKGQKAIVMRGEDKEKLRRVLFRGKEQFHKIQAKLPFEEKITLLIELQKIASEIRPSENRIVWKV
ncbi:MAG: hypothetical protein JW957_06465 [Candidatus Omnitrophica bacterium]|nr:hypothetical protein [Candidatus Omnitrophota bacterium]